MGRRAPPFALRAAAAAVSAAAAAHALLGLEHGGGPWHTDYRAFLRARDSSAGDARASASGVAEQRAPPLLQLHWQAPFLSAGGYCSEATAIAFGLLRVGTVPLSIEQHGDSYSEAYVNGLPLEDQTRLGGLLRAPRRAAAGTVSVCHSEPGAWHVSAALPARYATSVCPLPGAAVRVGRTMFESDTTPAGWAERLNALDEVWVPTAFQADVFAAGGVARDKLLVVPEPVDTDVFSPARVGEDDEGAAATAADGALRALGLPRRRCGAGEQPGDSPSCPFRFLSVGKWERRKGFDVLLRAYLSDFANLSSSSPASAVGGLPQGAAPPPAPPPHVELFILTSAYHSTRDFDAAVAAMVRGELACAEGVTPAQLASREATCAPTAAMRAAAGGAAGGPPPVRLLHDVPQGLLPAVYAAADAFVLASRGEGWGRPHVEAMAMALPVIATGWSGPSEYLTEANGYPLRHSALEPLADGPFAGHRMAAPDAVHLRELLRRVAGDEAGRREAAARGAQARRDMVALYSPTAVASFVAHHVARLSAAVAGGGGAGVAGGAGGRDEL